MSKLLHISYPGNHLFNHSVNISGSKSETNRLLLLSAIFNKQISLKNISLSEDSSLMQLALEKDTTTGTIDIHHAGTAMRFLTAYFSCQDNKTVLLTGSSRMKERPIGILVEALRQLGAVIEYPEKEGFPPLKIYGKKIKGGAITVSAATSSQYLTALLLMGSKMENGLIMHIDGKITSKPYLEMTVSMLKHFDIKTSWEGNTIKVYPKESIEAQTYAVESDWSSASYYYSLIAIKGGKIELSTYKKNSLQADYKASEIYQKYFGVHTTYANDKIILEKKGNSLPGIDIDLNDCPDIAQTIACTCAALKMKTNLSGLATLKIKETDRLIALQNELYKFGVQVQVTDDSLCFLGFHSPQKEIVVKTYNDHRMAMSFTPLSILDDFIIENPEVVNKSYPGFWEDIQAIGFQTSFS